MVARREVERIVPGLLDALTVEFPARDWDAELAELLPPRYMTPAPSTAARASGVYFEPAKVIRFMRFARTFRHVQGAQFADQRLELDLWQVVYVIGPVFGWLKPNGLRVYTVLYLEVGARNGKSTLSAVIALYLLKHDGEHGAQVASVAKDRDQAKLVFGAAAQMVLGSPVASEALHVVLSRHRIEHIDTGSTYTAVSSDKKGAAKNGLNLNGAIVDEFHVITDAELINTIEARFGSREQPLLVFITTAGIPEDNPQWVDRRHMMIQASEKVIDLVNQWGVIFAARDSCVTDGTWADESVWREANPGYPKSPTKDYLEGLARAAQWSSSKHAAFLRTNLNLPTSSVTDFIPITVWDRTASMVDEHDFDGELCFGGLDLSSSVDLSALVLVVPDRFPDFEYVDVVSRFWTPAETIVERGHRDRADYELWAGQGFLQTTPGPTIDYDAIEAEVVRMLDRYEVVTIDYDPWGSKQLRAHLEDAGARIGECRQGFATLSAPTKELERLVRERRLRHGGHPVLRYCVSNTVVVMDPAENIKPDKKHSRGRIDGTVALVMALNGLMRAVERGSSVYEDHGIEYVS